MKSKSFRLLWLGQLFANLGDVFYIVGLISILYEVTGSAFYLALLPFLNTFGKFISGILSPLLLNKFRLKSLLVTSQLYKTIVLFVLSCWVSFQLTPDIWFILLCIFLIAFLDGWAMPATSSMLPRLVEENELLKANSFVSVMTETAQLGGWAFGGILVAVLNGQNLIWLTFSLFVVSTIMMQKLKDETPFEVKENRQKIGEALKEGWMVIWKNPLFRSIHILILVESIANVVWVAAILYVFVTEVLHVTEAWWGYINTAFFIGLLLGGVICSRFSIRIEKSMRKTVIFSSIGISIVTILFGLNSVAWMALILVALSGLMDQIKGITFNTYLQKEAHPDDLPKIYSAQNALVSLVFGLSTLVFGIIAESMGITITFIMAGSLLAAVGIYLWTVRHRFPNDYSLGSDN